MTDLKNKSVWIFDLDGTLTRPVHDFAHIRQVLGIDPSDDILSFIQQQPAEKRCTMLAQLDELERFYAAQAQPASGVLELLNTLHSRQARLGILTRNTREMARLSLKAISAHEFFTDDAILGRDESQPKPSPDGINFLLNQWDENNLSAVMVGDFHYDLLCGRAAGVTTIHVDERERHWPDDTDVRVKNLKQIIDLLQ